MSKDEMSHDHITGDFQISQKPYWKLLLQSLFLICILFVAESMVIFLVEKPKYFLDCYCRGHYRISNFKIK